MPKIKNHDTVRFRKGRTVDTDHVEGGDLGGCRATVISSPFPANGVDGPKGQMRVAVAVDDDKAPRFAGLLTAPVENLEASSRWSRLKSFVGGIGPGKMRQNYGYEAPPLSADAMTTEAQA